MKKLKREKIGSFFLMMFIVLFICLVFVAPIPFVPRLVIKIIAIVDLIAFMPVLFTQPQHLGSGFTKNNISYVRDEMFS